MAFHLGKKEFIENLSSDVLDVETTIQRIHNSAYAGWYATTPQAADDAPNPTPTLHSWKYPGTSYLDVDTRNLVRCFHFNSHNQEESKTAHLVMTELLVDRLRAFLFVCGSVMERQIIQRPNNLLVFDKTFTERTLVASVVGYFTRVFLAFLASWNVGVLADGVTVQADTQTTKVYKPHSPCSACLWKTNWLQKVVNVISDTTGCYVDNSQSEISREKLRKLYDGAIDEKNRLTHSTQHMELTFSESTTEILKYTLKIKTSQILLDEIHKSLMQSGKAVEQTDKQLQELSQAAVNLQTASVLQAEENSSLEKKLEDIWVSSEVLEKKLTAWESKSRARARVYQLSDIAMREKNSTLLDCVEKINREISQLETCYDSAWQSKLREAEDKAKSLQELWNDTDGLLQFNKTRIVDLTLQLNDVTEKNERLQAELKRFVTA